MKKFFKFLISIILGIRGTIKTVINGKRARFRLNSKPILLVGNGPSLKDVDLLQLYNNDVDIGCVNWFALQSDDFFKIKPQYYFLIDPVFFNTSEKVKTLIKVLNRVDWSLKIVCIQNHKLELNNSFIDYDYISISDIDYTFYNRLTFKFLKNNYINCGLQNVMCGALFYSIITGYKKVYLIGIDMSEFQAYSIDINNDVYASYSHFYGTKKINCTETGSIPKGEFYKWLGFYAKMFKEFHFISVFAKDMNVDIINFSTESFIDCFPKENWHEI